MRRAFGMMGLGLVLAFALAAVIASCGGSDICLGCDGNSTPSPNTLVAVQGNIFQIQGSPALPEQVRVVICVDATGDFLSCENDAFTTGVSSTGEFSRTRITEGALRIGFRLDPNDDGRFDPDEPWAELQDPDGFLDDVAGGETAQVLDVTIDFAANTATAEEIEIVRASPTPAATATPAG
jgi:hypothetical protein